MGSADNVLCDDEQRCSSCSATSNAMPPFTSNPLNPNPMHSMLRKHPSLFGIPFLVIIVGASFGLQSFTQTRYDLHDQKIKKVCTTPPFIRSQC